MKFEIERSALVRAMSSVGKIPERRNTIPILANVLISARDGKVSFKATDLDIEAVEAVSAAVSDPGATSVPAHMLNDIARKLPDGSQARFEATKDGAQVKIQCGRSRFTLQALPETDFPDIQKGEMPHSYTMPGKALHRLLERVQFAISTEETRYYLNGIYLHAVDDKLCAVATDGHRLGKAVMPLPDGAKGAPGIIVPRKTVAEVMRLADKNEEVTVSIAPTKFQIRAGDSEITSKVIDGTFPDYQRVIPAANNMVMEAIGADVAAALDRALVIASEHGRATKFDIKDSKLTIAVINPDAGSSHEELEVEYSAEPIEIGFNGRYLTEILSQIESEKVRVHLDSPGSPTLITPDGDPDVTYVLMPMRI